MANSKFREYTCCFTGHREIPLLSRFRIKRNTERAIIDLIENHGVKYFGVGGAVGYDTLAANILFNLRETTYKDIKIILVLPFFEGFTKYWTEDQKLKFISLYDKYDKHVILDNRPSKEAYLRRNRHLIDNSKYCICYKIKDTGGTAYTCKYAESRKLIIVNIN